MDDADRLLRELAIDMRANQAEATGHMMEQLESEIPELGDPDVNAGARDLVTQTVGIFLDLIENGFDYGEEPPAHPVAAVKLARMLADRDIPVSAMLRSYRLGLAVLTPLLLENLARRTEDPAVLTSATIKLAAAGLTWMDVASERAFTTYQEERERRVQRQLELVTEASTSIGTTLDIGDTAHELADVGVRHFADLVAIDLLEDVLAGEANEPGPGPLVLHQFALCSAHDPQLTASAQRLSYPEGSPPERAIRSGQSSRHRLDNPRSPDWHRADPVTTRAFEEHDIGWVLLMPLRARGSTLGIARFFRRGDRPGYSDEDMLLVRDLVARAAVSIDNARRYTHERATALTLQRALLPQHPPEQSAVDVASRYLPAGSHAGVGGDWYDVIPLSGARVALVVGDVVGHGLYASATMGRLRTAVRTLADVDLAPDELLTHLDDVVIRLGGQDTEHGQESSATCLYAVYDPVSRQCSVASAGHVTPAVVSPEGEVSFPDLPIGPPLGLGGLPFEKSELMLPEGSLLTLYTDGLIEGRHRDVDTGLAILTEVLRESAAPGRGASLEQICDALTGRLVSSRPTDDIALLLARTKTLDADQVFVMDLAADPSVVSEARKATVEVLDRWGLADTGYTAELVVSELVTNAIRYGSSPIKLRLIRDRALICEVSDGSSTSPHLRRARVYDEGGRGLLLVAQLAQRWGTRYTRDGKIIWAELPLLPDLSALMSTFEE
ncbi:SpoIIE family protein phosphatase [Streptomyces sp. NA04227]|uniref:ATP-binding SpoIIE family protein phosphatase n=1 Tax=Streptomyces sp. NA04227 TaxID=2742136 RepID=UPI00159265A5|nr:SpoIIE family protein phosphatase [Streptomyces sp. NA04227]QKW08330.1 SpoIIE family protein phosphatase [Streptomyces sp. NA04227]